MWAAEDRSEEIGPCVVTAKPCVSTKLSVSSWTQWTTLFPASVRARSSAAPLRAGLKPQAKWGSIAASPPNLSWSFFYPPRREMGSNQPQTFSCVTVHQCQDSVIWCLLHLNNHEQLFLTAFLLSSFLSPATNDYWPYSQLIPPRGVTISVQNSKSKIESNSFPFFPNFNFNSRILIFRG